MKKDKFLALTMLCSLFSGVSANAQEIKDSASQKNRGVEDQSDKKTPSSDKNVEKITKKSPNSKKVEGGNSSGSKKPDAKKDDKEITKDKTKGSGEVSSKSFEWENFKKRFGNGISSFVDLVKHHPIWSSIIGIGGVFGIEEGVRRTCFKPKNNNLPNGPGLQLHVPPPPPHGPGIPPHGPGIPPHGPGIPPHGPGLQLHVPPPPPHGPGIPPHGPGPQLHGPGIPLPQPHGPEMPPHGPGIPLPQPHGPEMPPPKPAEIWGVNKFGYNEQEDCIYRNSDPNGRINVVLIGPQQLRQYFLTNKECQDLAAQSLKNSCDGTVDVKNCQNCVVKESRTGFNNWNITEFDYNYSQEPTEEWIDGLSKKLKDDITLTFILKMKNDDDDKIVEITNNPRVKEVKVGNKVFEDGNGLPTCIIKTFAF